MNKYLEQRSDVYGQEDEMEFTKSILDLEMAMKKVCVITPNQCWNVTSSITQC